MARWKVVNKNQKYIKYTQRGRHRVPISPTAHIATRDFVPLTDLHSWFLRWGVAFSFVPKRGSEALPASDGCPVYGPPHRPTGHRHTNDNINSKGSFSELLFSFVLGKYTICDICTIKSPAFETTSLLYVTPTDFSSMQELLMQEHKQKLYKACSCCGRDTWHIESKKKLQPPNYLIIIVNRITYSNNRITKNKSRIPLDLYIKLGPYKFSLQASVDHHGYSLNSGHYTASINCCGKTFHCNDNKITECNITDTYNSSTAYILLYKLMLC